VAPLGQKRAKMFGFDSEWLGARDAAAGKTKLGCTREHALFEQLHTPSMAHLIIGRMSKLGTLICSLLLVSACARAIPPASSPPASSAKFATASRRPLDRVVVVTVDGLRPSDAMRLPTIGQLAREGAFAAPPEGALSVLPSVTYPTHTTLVTGVYPASHGITTNLVLAADNDTDLGEWRWYRKDIRVATLYDVALDAQLRTALLHWPVTVGARATALIPEFRDRGEKMSPSVLRSLSTPGFPEEVARRYPPFYEKHTSDEAVIDAAITTLDTVHPNLMFIHIAQTDSAEHKYGPDSPEAEAARIHADQQVARLLSALRASRTWERTVLVIASDHGFASIAQQVSPLVPLTEAGLGGRVIMNGGGGLTFFYLRSPDDTEAEALTRELLTTLAADASSGVATVLDREAIAAHGGDPGAFMAIEAAIGFSIGRKRTGPLVTESKKKGTHGYLPERPEMRATLLFYGPRIVPSHLVGTGLVDVAPTIAPWLGLSLPEAQGKPLPITLK